MEGDIGDDDLPDYTSTTAPVQEDELVNLVTTASWMHFLMNTIA